MGRVTGKMQVAKPCDRNRNISETWEQASLLPPLLPATVPLRPGPFIPRVEDLAISTPAGDTPPLSAQSRLRHPESL